MEADLIVAAEQIGSLIALFSPLLLFAFKNVRRAAVRLAAWAWAPIGDQLAKRDARINALAEAINGLRRDLVHSLDDLRLEVHALRDQANIVISAMRVQADANESIGYFETAADGENVFVSSTYAAWMGVSRAELLRWGFLNFTHEADRERVEREWVRARAQHREYRELVRMGPMGGPYKPFKVVAQPVPDAPPALAWIGTLRPLRDDPLAPYRRATDCPIVQAQPPRTDTGD